MFENIETTIVLKDVCLSFPHLFQKYAGKAGNKPKFSAAIIMETKRHKATIDLIRSTMLKMATEKWKQQSGFKHSLVDGNEKPNEPGYGDGTMYINASSDRAPHIVKRDKTRVQESEAATYAYPGCYVNAWIKLWSEKKDTYGKRISFSLEIVQFVRDGERLASGGLDVDEVVPNLDEEGDEDPEKMF